MVATNAVRPRSGNVSAGTSVFAMIVLEKSLARVHEEIDIVVTPDGRPVAMAHANNGSSDLDAWISLFGQVAKALDVETRLEDLYGKLLPLAVRGDPDAGGLLSINYVSGEHMTGFTEGRPLFARSQDSKFTLENFVRAMYYASLCAMRTGMDILTEQEGVVIEEIRGHGGPSWLGGTGERPSFGRGQFVPAHASVSHRTKAGPHRDRSRWRCRTTAPPGPPPRGPGSPRKRAPSARRVACSIPPAARSSRTVSSAP